MAVSSSVGLASTYFDTSLWPYVPDQLWFLLHFSRFEGGFFIIIVGNYGDFFGIIFSFLAFSIQKEIGNFR